MNTREHPVAASQRICKPRALVMRKGSAGSQPAIEQPKASRVPTQGMELVSAKPPPTPQIAVGSASANSSAVPSKCQTQGSSTAGRNDNRAVAQAPRSTVPPVKVIACSSSGGVGLRLQIQSHGGPPQQEQLVEINCGISRSRISRIFHNVRQDAILKYQPIPGANEIRTITIK